MATRLLTDGAALHVEARLRLLEAAEGEAAALVAAAGAPPASNRGEPPDQAVRRRAG
jgi:hypothetical protein